MGMYDITGWSGGGRRPLTYNLRPGQFRNMGGVNIWGFPRNTIINNYGGGFGNYNYGCDDGGMPKWMQWTMGGGMIMNMLGQMMQAFFPQYGAGGTSSKGTLTADQQQDYPILRDLAKTQGYTMRGPDSKGAFIVYKKGETPQKFESFDAMRDFIESQTINEDDDVTLKNPKYDAEIAETIIAGLNSKHKNAEITYDTTTGKFIYKNKKYTFAELKKELNSKPTTTTTTTTTIDTVENFNDKYNKDGANPKAELTAPASDGGTYTLKIGTSTISGIKDPAEAAAYMEKLKTTTTTHTNANAFNKAYAGSTPKPTLTQNNDKTFTLKFTPSGGSERTISGLTTIAQAVAFCDAAGIIAKEADNTNNSQTNNSNNNGTTTYTLRPGDTWYSITKKYNIPSTCKDPIGDLEKANELNLDAAQRRTNTIGPAAKAKDGQITIPAGWTLKTSGGGQ